MWVYKLQISLIPNICIYLTDWEMFKMEDIFCWSFCLLCFGGGRFFVHSTWLATDLSSLTRD